jgi:hypothetical protein
MLQNVNEVSNVMALKAPQYDVITESLHVVLRINNGVKCLTSDSYCIYHLIVECPSHVKAVVPLLNINLLFVLCL